MTRRHHQRHPVFPHVRRHEDGRALSWGISALLLFTLGLTPARTLLEASMTRHMLIQMPLLAAAGFFLARTLPAALRGTLRRIAGGPVPWVVAAMLASSFWMLPRALDLALATPLMEAAKFISLPLLVGAPLALAWERLGPIGRGFVWTNFFSMLVVLGWLYAAAPVRICNNYLASDQHDAGWWMIRLAVAMFIAWLASLFVGGGTTDARSAAAVHPAPPAS